MRRVLTDNGSVPVPTVAELSDLPSSVTTARVAEGNGQLWYKNGQGVWSPATPTVIEFSMAKTNFSGPGAWVNSYTPTIRFTSGWSDAFYISGTVMRVARAGIYTISTFTGFHRTGDGDTYYTTGSPMMYSLAAASYIHGTAFVSSTTTPAARAMGGANINGSIGAYGSMYGAFPASVYAFTSFIRIELNECR